MLGAVLGAGFPNVCLVLGVGLFLVGIIGGGCDLKGLRIPRMKTFARVLSVVMALVLIGVPVLCFFFGTTIGLVRVGKMESEPAAIQRSSSSVSYAWAEERTPQIGGRLSIEERHKKILKDAEFAGEVTIYVSDVHLKEPTKILIFKTGREKDKWKDSDKISYDRLKDAVNEDDVLLSAKVKEGVEATFTFKERRYTVKVSRVIWYLIGKSYVEVEIHR